MTRDQGAEKEIFDKAPQRMGEAHKISSPHRDEIEKAIRAGLASLRAGKGIDGESVFDCLETDLSADMIPRETLWSAARA